MNSQFGIQLPQIAYIMVPTHYQVVGMALPSFVYFVFSPTRLTICQSCRVQVPILAALVVFRVLLKKFGIHSSFSNIMHERL